MKINEIKQPTTVNEGVGDMLGGLSRALVGDQATSAIKGMFTGRGTKSQLTQDIFFKDFINDAITSLQNGIKSGVIDPRLTSEPTITSSSTTLGASEVDPSKVAPAPGEPGAPSATSNAVAAKKAQQQTIQTINNYIAGAAKAINSTNDKKQKIALTKELVNSMADRQGSPEWENALAGVQGIIKRAGVDPTFAATAISNLKSGKTMSEAWRVNVANRLIESVGLTWKDLGLCVLKEGKSYYIAETRFVKMDMIFESIMEQTEGARSIGDYMLEWFTAYMAGTTWESYRPKIAELCKNIEAAYPKGNWKAAIKTLAQAAYSLPGSGKAKGVQNANAGQQRPATQTKMDFGAGGQQTDAVRDLLSQSDIAAAVKKNPALAAKYSAYLK
jgi:hypothetical protein